MKNNNKDIFEIKSRALSSNNNFFLSEDSSNNLFEQSTVSEPSRRLNDYDFNLLKEDAYKDISDDLFKLEYKISKVEEDLKTIDSQIEAAREIKDYDLVRELGSRKNLLQEDFETLIAIYNDKSVSAKISDRILSLFGNKIKLLFSDFQQKTLTFSDAIISRMPKQFSSVIELKKSLSKLENLNKSVDELIALNVPYGENYNKYEQLSKYIIKANSIQAEISKYIKK